MVLRTKTKKSTLSRFTHSSFQGRVKRAGAYRRSGLGWRRDVQVLRAFLSRVHLKSFMVMGFLLVVLAALIYYPPLLSVRNITVSGLPAAWATEVQNQVRRYMQDRRLLLFPGDNIALVDRHGLATFLTTVNAHVQRVDAIERHWPHTIEIIAAPRIPAFVWSDSASGVSVLISNDGKVLPESERDASMPLALFGSVLATTDMGGQAIGGELLKALEVVRTQFVPRTGLAGVAQVELVPLVIVPPAPSSEALVAQPVVGLGLSTVTHELRLTVLPDALYKTSAFTVYLDISTPIPDALDRLRVLLDRQPVERRGDLQYVDLRFPARAYVCVRSASCATAEQADRVNVPVVRSEDRQ